MRHIVLAFGLSGLLFIGLTNRTEGQPNQNDELARYRQAGLNGGNPVRGKAVFESEKAACTKCHVLKGDERRAGPDLHVIGDKFGREELVEAVLEPSKRIHPDYGTIIASTTDGNVHTGVLCKRTHEDIFTHCFFLPCACIKPNNFHFIGNNRTRIDCCQ